LNLPFLWGLQVEKSQLGKYNTRYFYGQSTTKVFIKLQFLEATNLSKITFIRRCLFTPFVLRLKMDLLFRQDAQQFSLSIKEDDYS
jgi:hypothetical protein